MALLQIKQIKLETSLLSLMQQQNNEDEHEIQEEHAQLSEKLDSTKSLLTQKEAANENCDDVRAEVTKLTGQLELKKMKLAACISSKKEINAKLAQAEEATEVANAALQKCQNTKAQLASSLKECKDRCHKVSASLAECLARKVVLKKKIKECHDAKNLAKEKLEECLARKDELKEKIQDLESKLGASLLQGKSRAHDNMTLSSAVQAILGIMQDLTQAERDAEKLAAAGLNAEGNVEAIESAMNDNVQAANAAASGGESAIQNGLSALAGMQADLATAISAVHKAAAKDGAADQIAHAADTSSAN